MGVRGVLFSRYGRRRRAGYALAVPASVGALMAAVALIGGVLPGVPASKALAELVARSPGMRIGGTALKAKQRRAEIYPASSTPGSPGPRTAMANVLGSSFGPEDMSGLPSGPEDFPEDFNAPPIPVEAALTPEEIPFLRLPNYPDQQFRGPPIIVAPPVDETRPVRVAPIPEPASWALLILGFGMVGASLRRKQAHLALA